MKSRIILTSLLFLWMFIIFMFSNQPATVSEFYSDSFTSQVIDATLSITNNEINEDEKIELIEDLRFIIRKTAHFSLYFILNLLAYFTFKAYGIKNSFLYSILFSFLFACTDEFHQLFIDNRSGRIFDVFIDTTGAIICSLTIVCFKKLKKEI